jgi:DNA-binding GntR family transcriptional regulator
MFSSNEPKSISPKQLRHWVADRLRAAIVEGKFKPGEWLRQERLAQEFGVSQMPVREALRTLAAEGLVEHIPYRGTRVIEFSPQDVADLYAHRAFLEAMAAHATARYITSEEIGKLQDLQDQMKKRLGPKNLTEYRELNRLFHQTIFKASRRNYLIRTLDQIWAAFPTMLWSDFIQTAKIPLPERATDRQEHDAILAALEKRDADEAERLMRRHIETAGRQLTAVLREQK